MTNQTITADTCDEVQKRLDRASAIAAIAGKLEVADLQYGALGAAMWAVTDEIELVQKALGLTTVADLVTARNRRHGAQREAIRTSRKDSDRPEEAS